MLSPYGYEKQNLTSVRRSGVVFWLKMKVKYINNKQQIQQVSTPKDRYVENVVSKQDDVNDETNLSQRKVYKAWKSQADNCNRKDLKRNSKTTNCSQGNNVLERRISALHVIIYLHDNTLLLGLCCNSWVISWTELAQFLCHWMK